MMGEEKCYDFVPLTSHIVYLFVYIQLCLCLEVYLVKSFSHCSFSSNILSSSLTLCSLMAYDNKIYWNITKPWFLTHEVITKSSAYLLGNSTSLAEPNSQRGGYGARANPAFLKSVERNDSIKFVSCFTLICLHRVTCHEVEICSQSKVFHP